jgi:hypothetical protein
MPLARRTRSVTQLTLRRGRRVSRQQPNFYFVKRRQRKKRRVQFSDTVLFDAPSAEPLLFTNAEEQQGEEQQGKRLRQVEALRDQLAVLVEYIRSQCGAPDAKLGYVPEEEPPQWAYAEQTLSRRIMDRLVLLWPDEVVLDKSRSMYAQVCEHVREMRILLRSD